MNPLPCSSGILDFHDFRDVVGSPWREKILRRLLDRLALFSGGLYSHEITLIVDKFEEVEFSYV